MLGPDLVQIAFEHFGPGTFVPRDPLAVRVEPQTGMLFVTFPEGGRSVRRHVLNKTAGAIYRLLDGRRTVADIADLFSARFPDVALADLRFDIVFLIQAMRRKGLIVAAPDSAEPEGLVD